MAKGHAGLPKPSVLEIAKTQLLASLKSLDSNAAAVQRVLSMETDFR